MSVCSNQFPTTSVLYSELSNENNIGVPVVTSLCCLLAVIVLVVYTEEVWFIVHHYPHKKQRNKFILLLGLYPVISIMSGLTLLIPTATFLCELVTTTYLSICIMLFVQMFFAYFGGQQQILQQMSEEKIGFGTPPCCCCCFCLNNKPFNRRNLQIAIGLAFQLCIVKPLLSFISAVLWTDGRYTVGDESSPQYAMFYINWISVISTLLGIWGLLIIFRSTRTKLKIYRVDLKFASLQLVLLFLNVQFAVIGILARNDIPACEGTRGPFVRGKRIHHSLLVLEMFLLSILARFAYRRTDPELLHENELRHVDKSAINNEVVA